MNTAQTVFTIFFAISWGNVAGALTRWKPFNGALLFCDAGFLQPTLRYGFSFLMLNVVPWILFAITLVILDGPDTRWSFTNAALLTFRAVLPGLIPFGLYRIWQAVIRSYPDYFYARTQDLVPNPFRTTTGNYQVEPDQQSLSIRNDGVVADFLLGAGYVAIFLCCFIGR